MRDIDSLDVVVVNEDITLPAVLTMPLTEGAYEAPGVVIVHGSGALSSSGTFSGALGVHLGHPVDVYTSMAEQLVWEGVAVLRYDKRTCFAEQVAACTNRAADYPGDPNGITVDQLVGDARAAVATLGEIRGIRSDDLFVIGHSQGAAFVPELLEETSNLRGGVMLAGPVTSLKDLLAGQLEVLADYLEKQNPQDPTIADLRNQAQATREALQQIEDGTYAGDSYQGTKLAFWHSWIALQDGLPDALSSTTKPILALYGDLDFNVWPEHYEQMLAWSSNPELDLEAILMSAHTHPFVVVDGGIPGSTFSAEAATKIVAWIHR